MDAVTWSALLEPPTPAEARAGNRDAFVLGVGGRGNSWGRAPLVRAAQRCDLERATGLLGRADALPEALLVAAEVPARRSQCSVWWLRQLVVEVLQGTWIHH